MNYHFSNIKTCYLLYGTAFTIIMCCISKRCEVMDSNKVFRSLSHGMRIKFVSTMVSITIMKGIHDCFIIDLVVIDFALCGCSSMELRTGRTNFPDSNLRRKKPIDCRMNAIEAIISKGCSEMCHLRNNKYYLLSPTFHKRSHNGIQQC